MKYFDKIFIFYGGGDYIKRRIRLSNSTSDYLSEYEKADIEVMLNSMATQLSDWSKDKSLNSVNMDSIICEREGSLCYIGRNEYFDRNMLFNNCIFSEGEDHYFPSSDETATLLSRYICPDIFLFLTKVDGVYCPFPFVVGQLPLREININNMENISFDAYTPGLANISQKVDWALWASTFSKQTIIANGEKFDNIKCIFAEKPYVGTKISGGEKS